MSVEILDTSLSLAAAHTWTADQTFNADVFIGDGFGMVIGHDAKIVFGNQTPELQILGTTFDDASFGIAMFSETDTAQAVIRILKSGNATIGSNTAVVDDEFLGAINAYGADGTDFDTLVTQIRFAVDDSSIATGQIGGEILFRTATSGGTMTTAMTIGSAQEVGIGIAPVTGVRLLLPQEDDAVTPTLAFGGGGYGLYSPADNTLNIALAGAVNYTINAAGIFSTATNGAQLDRTTPSATIPGHTFRSDSNTGVGTAAADQLSMIAGATEGIRVTQAGGTNEVSVSFAGAAVDGAAFALNNTQDRTFITSVGSQFHMPAQTSNFDNGSGTIAIGAGTFFGIPTWTGDAATLTMTDPATVVIEGVPVASTNVAFSNAAKALWVIAGSSQFGGNVVMGNDALIERDVNAGLTASTTQTQGQGALTAEVNEVATVANANDTVTLPEAVAGLKIVIINNGANTLRIFPASGDDLGQGADTATTLASGSNVVFQAYDTTNWEII